MEMKNSSSSFSCASSSSLEEVSVSFGRFEGDCSASWEKWSSFSPNKYLEEVEKCSTPGSVAQKKAYFEAHYNKPIVVAAAAAAASNQYQQQTDTDVSPAVPQEMDDLELSNNNDHGKIIMTEVTDPVFDVKIENCQILLQENIHLTESLEKEVTVDASEKPQKVEINKKPQKVEIKKKPQKVEIKKKSPLPLLTKSTKSTSTTTVVASSSSSANVVTSMGKSISPATDRKTNYANSSSSLHNNMSMSLLLGHDATTTTTRKSLIMEKMEDKDIVKRAFRTFQNNFNQSIRSAVDVADEKNKSTQRKQLSISTTSQTQTKLNQNDSTRKKTTTPTPLVKADIQGSQPGSSKVTKSPGLPKASAVDQRKAKPAPSPGLRNDDEKEDRAETLKEKKKLEDKSAKLKGKTHLSTIPKGKGGKAQVIGQPKPKSKVIYQEGKTTTKGGLLEMEGAKNEKHRQPELRV
ncbi:protein WVD2-like 7 [Impatiens glandulifera]|uniref:protein WVD2-like 7 n=1 Tax=Impatiens glandulifera TaxID=253017 RepID=UPI001FB13210|nr:protein WVD2-like 7 [Impatiens glandulifera]